MKKWFESIGKTAIRNIIAVICVTGVMGLLFLSFFKPIPEENKDVLTRAIDQVLVLGFGVVIGYYFFASKDEADRIKQNGDKKD